MKGTKQLKLDPTIYDALIKEKVSSFNTFVSTHHCIYVYSYLTQFVILQFYLKCCCLVS